MQIERQYYFDASKITVDTHLDPIKLYWLSVERDPRISATWMMNHIQSKTQEVMPNILGKILGINLSICRIITEYYQN